MQDPNLDPAFFKPIISISIPPAQREAFYGALLTLREREQRPFVSLSALVVKAVIAAAEGQSPNTTNMPAASGEEALPEGGLL
jgi:hypothetical protein